MKLYPFQEKCVKWLGAREKNGAMLVAKMGLGKTIMALELVHRTLSEQQRKGQCTLYLTPWVLIQNVINTSERFYGRELKVSGFHRRYSRENPVGTCDIVVSSYKRLAYNADEFGKHQYFRVIYDESHLLGRKCNKFLQVARRLRSRRKILMSGTPFYRGLRDIVTQLAVAGVIVDDVPGTRVTHNKLQQSLVIDRHVRFENYSPETLVTAPLDVEALTYNGEDWCSVVNDRLRELPSRVVIFSDNDVLMRRLDTLLRETGRPSLLVTRSKKGATSGMYRAIETFKRGKSTVLVMSSKVAAHGFDLSCARVVFLTSSSGHVLQLLARVHRPSLTSPPTHTAIVVMRPDDQRMRDLLSLISTRAN